MRRRKGRRKISNPLRCLDKTCLDKTPCFIHIYGSYMVDIAQGLESQIVDLDVAGSNPVIHLNIDVFMKDG